MHPIVLDATGYTLLLSSFIALVILLWKGCKRKKKSPFYALSVSDTFSAALTAVVLLVNHIEAGMKLNYNWQNNTSSNVPNHAWTIEDNYRFPFLQPHDLREVFDEINRNVTLTCGMKDILVQYGTLLAALTNAFISLLTFTVQCNLNASCIKKRCTNVMKSLRNTRIESKDAQVKRREIEEIFENEQEPGTSLQQDSIKVKTRSNIIQRIKEISKFRTQKEDDKKPTSLLLTSFLVSHWLVPFLVVGILYFAEYSDMNNVKHTEDIECLFESNFPMNYFDTFSDTDDNLNIIDSVAYITPHNYFLNEKLSNESKPNSVEIDEVVSKVQSIVRTALRHTSTKDIETIHFFNTSGPQNLTEYILANNIMKLMKNITNINSIVEGLNDTLMEQNTNAHKSSTNNNIYLNQDSEIPLFHGVPKNVSEELDATTSGNLSSVSQVSVENEDNSYREDTQIYAQTTTRTTTNFTSKNATFISNNQIYGEIMKRIQAASAYSAAKNHYNRSVSRSEDGDQSKISTRKYYIAKRKPNSIKDVFSDENDNRYAETKQNGLPNIINECLISTKFLKLQLFVLSFAIYFLSILLSCILQMRGKYMCKNTLATLRRKSNLPSTAGRKTHPRESPSGEAGSRTPQGLRNGTDERDTDEEDCERENESIALEIDCMVRIFNTMELSLILCVVFWTPAFLGTLLRVYSCIRAPQWLTDTTFLSAFAFGIVRNALNINIIKIQEACNDASTKGNRIHPVLE